MSYISRKQEGMDGQLTSDGALKRSAEDRALDRFADMMIEKIKTISEDWKKPWFTEGTLSWPKNLDGREYNGMNALMLYMHCENEGYKVPVFATFDRIAGLNYKGGRKTGGTPAVDKEGNPLPKVSVLTGAKSFPVFLTTFTVVNPDTHEKIKYDDYKNLSNEEKEKYKVYPKLNVYNVFNVDQTNLQASRPELYQKLVDANTVKKPERAEGELFSFPAVDTMIRNNQWVCPITPKHQNDAYYSPSKDMIVTPEKEQFTSGEAYYGTTFHEMVHSTGAKDRLDRQIENVFGSPEYAREEFVAELGSALLAERYGFSKQTKEESCAYLKSWLESLKQSPDFLKTVLTDVKKASAMVIDSVEKVELDMKLGNVDGIEEGKQNNEEQDKEPQQVEESVAAQGVPQPKKDSVYAVVSPSTGRYVTQVVNPVVYLGAAENALLFDSRDKAKAVARECRSYVPDLRFSVREMPSEITVRMKPGPDELGIVSRLGNNWMVSLVGAYDSGDLHDLTRRAERLGGVQDASSGDRFIFISESDARKFNHVKGAFMSVEQQEEQAKQIDRLSDLAVVLRGESHEPWLTGKVDGEQVTAEKLSSREFSAYRSMRVSVEDLALNRFKEHLSVMPEEKMSQVMSR